MIVGDVLKQALHIDFYHSRVFSPLKVEYSVSPKHILRAAPGVPLGDCSLADVLLDLLAC